MPDTTFYEDDLEQPITPMLKSTMKSIDIVSTPGSWNVDDAATPATTAGETRLLRPHGNPMGNGQWTGQIEDKPLAVKWTAPHTPGYPPQFVMPAGDRVLLQCEMIWQLFDDAGKLIAEHGRAEGDLAIDLAAGFVYANTTPGMMARWRLADGSDAGRFFCWFGRDFQRSVVGIEADDKVDDGVGVTVASEPLPFLDHHQHIEPEFGIVETQRIASVDIDQDDMLKASRSASLMTRPPMKCIAATPTGWVIATDGALYLLDGSLQVVVELRGRIDPIALSVDAGERIHLLSRATAEPSDANHDHATSDIAADDADAPDIKGDRPLYRVITPAGRELLTAPLDLDAAAITTAPVLATTGEAFVFAGERLVAINPAGRVVVHDFQPGQTIAGVTATSGRFVLVTAGRHVVAIDAGNHMLEDQSQLKEPPVVRRWDAAHPLVTPAVVGDGSRVYVAGVEALYCLAAAP